LTPVLLARRREVIDGGERERLDFACSSFAYECFTVYSLEDVLLAGLVSQLHERPCRVGPAASPGPRASPLDRPTTGFALRHLKPDIADLAAKGCDGVSFTLCHRCISGYATVA